MWAAPRYEKKLVPSSYVSAPNTVPNWSAWTTTSPTGTSSASLGWCRARCGSTCQRWRPLRTDTYVALLREAAARQPWGKRPNYALVASVVLYNGEDRWPAMPTPPPAWMGGEVKRGVRFHMVDVGPHGRYDPEWRGAAAAVSHLERARTPGAFAEVFAKLVEDLPSPEDAGLRRAFYRWALRLVEHRELSVEELNKVEDLMEVPRIVERMKQWEKDWYRQGQQQVLVRQAGTKFGSAVARRLEAALEGIADPDRTAAISDLVLEHETGDEFMAAVHGTG